MKKSLNLSAVYSGKENYEKYVQVICKTKKEIKMRYMPFSGVKIDFHMNPLCEYRENIPNLDRIRRTL